MAQKRTASTKAAPKTTGSKTARTPKGPLKQPTSTKSAAKKAPVKASTPASSRSTAKKKPLTAKVRASETRHRHDPALLELRAFGLSYPEAHLKSPWPEHLDLAVRDKTFAYLSLEGEALRISCKLPQSSQAALDLAFTEPTEYGLGKSGWVTATFKDDEEPPVAFLKTWLDESYRAQAPKSLSKGLPKMT